MGRPRLPVTDPKVDRRRAQWRNSKLRARGIVPPDDIAPKVRLNVRASVVRVSVLVGKRWIPATIVDGRRVMGQ